MTPDLYQETFDLPNMIFGLGFILVVSLWVGTFCWWFIKSAIKFDKCMEKYLENK